MNTHRAWRPRVDGAPLFNPFAPVTQRNQISDHVDLTDTEEQSDSQRPPDKVAERIDDQPSPAK